MSKITTILGHQGFGYDFIAEQYLPPGKDEYYLRNEQLGKTNDDYRPLLLREIDILTKNLNYSPNWDDVLVNDPFDPNLIRNTEFYGLVRIGALQQQIVSFHDFAVPVGIANSRIISCDIGDYCAILDCTYLSHYIIDDRVILYRIGEMQATDHAKFGNGILKDGEPESVLITIDIINEASTRAVRPFSGMLPADAYLWGTYREDTLLMRAFERLTDATMDSRRGYYGYVGSKTVIKSCDTIKDVHIGSGAYIKGANKLKNLTLRSSLEEPVQIGEGVELVNGIIGGGSRIFYGVKAIRFVLGDNSNLKYGARLIHSVLGDNSTVSCCELLNSLIFGSHEQHHNNSFLIASLIMGQSNMAAGANIGSNHNSRTCDGELIAARGFWPALSSSLKYDSKFASFVLLDQAHFPHQMHIPLPFSLVTVDPESGRRLIIPAYWWLYNLYALERNSYKFALRDTRKVKRQQSEMEYLAPDTAGEIMEARTLLERWVGAAHDPHALEAQAIGAALLTQHPEVIQELTVLALELEDSNEPMLVVKVVEAYKAYEEMLLYYIAKSLVSYCTEEQKTLSDLLTSTQKRHDLRWLNIGGQIVREDRVDALLGRIKSGAISNWEQVHQSYEAWNKHYSQDRALHALGLLEVLLGDAVLDQRSWDRVKARCLAIGDLVNEQVYKSKNRDYTDSFRERMFRSKEEMEAVLPRIEEDPFIAQVQSESSSFKAKLESLQFS